MTVECQVVADEELKRLRDIQRLLQALLRALGGAPELIGLEEIL